MNVTIYGPNLPRSLSSKGTLVVHRTGCGDTLRPPYTRLSSDQGGWPIDAESVLDVVEDVYPADNFDYDPSNADELSPYLADIHFFPCTNELTEPEL